MSVNGKKPVRYAVFRTRLQPYTIAHTWAIDTFLQCVHQEDGKHTLGATHLILAIVDPLLLKTSALITKRPRLDPNLNPFAEWMSGEMAHSARCSLKKYNGRAYCNRVTITRIPSPVLLSSENIRTRKKAAKELRSRLPLKDKNTIWYFPCLDEEDTRDIKVLWTSMKREEKDGGIPHSRILVAHNPDYQYKVHKAGDTIGIYFAGLIQLLGYKLDTDIGVHPIIPASICDRIEYYQGQLGLDYDRCKTKLLDTEHQAWVGPLFKFQSSSAIGDALSRSHRTIFGGSLNDRLSVIPLDRRAFKRQDILNSCISDLIVHIGPREKKGRLRTMIDEIKNSRFGIGEKRAKTIAQELRQLDTTQFARRGGLSKELTRWQQSLSKLTEG